MILLTLISVASSQTNNTPSDSGRAAELMDHPYPTTGMTITDLASFTKQLESMFPVGPQIIGVTLRDENTVIVKTGKQVGPLSGSGDLITYEKKNGKWVETDRLHWKS